MSAYLDIIILLFVVVMVFAKLKALLGTRPENETKISRESAAKIFEIIMKEQNRQPQTAEGGVLKAFKLSDLSETDRLLAEIPGFDKDKFLKGAERAFEIIINAFANADTDRLKSLLDPKLFAKFEAVIKQRQEDGITAETDFVGFESVEITAVKITKGGLAKISVKFVSEQANLLRNAAGEVIEGDENFIQSITDIWTFERDINSTSPLWRLASTKK